MGATEKLFYQNAYSASFTATVIRCEPQGERFAVELDRTAFYPEGGGQPGDTGTAGGINILDTHEKDGAVIHYAAAPLPPGQTVECQIDWPRRFLFMQQHTGEHILSGLCNRLYHLDNVGFHMGEKAVTVDFNGILTRADLDRLESLANEAVFRNLPVTAEYPSPSALKELSYRSKKELFGKVRIVTIPDYDICACCGLHTAQTGEIGIIKILSCQHYKGGVRLMLAMGSRAVEDYGEKVKNTSAISSLLSAKQEEIVPAVERLLAERDSLKQEISLMRQEHLAARASAIAQGTARVCLFETEMQPGDLRVFCLKLCERAEIAAVFSSEEGSVWKYAIGSRSADMRAASRALNAAFHGRGGGKKELAQGTVSGSAEELQRFINAL